MLIVSSADMPKSQALKPELIRLINSTTRKRKNMKVYILVCLFMRFYELLGKLNSILNNHTRTP